MGLNNIEITDFIIGEWYKDNLIAQPVGHTPATDFQQSAVNSLPVPPSAPRTTPNSNCGEFAAITPNCPNTTPPAAPPPLRYLGNNRRNITLLVNSPNTAFLPDDQLAFLTKILEACRMTIADVAIVNQATTPVTIAALQQQLTPAIILLFGMEPIAIRLPINFPVFKIQTYDQCTYLSAPALDQLVLPSEEGKLLKSKLWVTLKTLFGV
jgi:hypothetical protein